MLRNVSGGGRLKPIVVSASLVAMIAGGTADEGKGWGERLAGNQEKIQQRLSKPEMKDLEARSFSMKPIGIFHSPLTPETGAPRQGRLAPEIKAVIEILPKYEACLEGLERMSHIYVLFAFDRSRGWNPKVTPPSTGVQRGLFSTRSPSRPNPIGLTVVRLERVEGRRLYVSGVDAFDQTPVLDIKPYVSSIDGFTDAEMKAEKELGLDP